MTKVREDKLSYVVQVSNILFVRSRKMLKLSNSTLAQITQENDSIPQSLPTATAASTSSTLLINQQDLLQPNNFHIHQQDLPQPSNFLNIRSNQQAAQQQSNLNYYIKQQQQSWATGSPPSPRSRPREPLHKRGMRPSNSIGPRSVQGSHPSPLSSSSSSSLQYATRKINKATGEPGALSCTTSCTRFTGPPQDQNRQDRGTPSTPSVTNFGLAPNIIPMVAYPSSPPMAAPVPSVNMARALM